MNKKTFKILIFLLLVFAPLATVKAADVKMDTSVYVTKDQIINGSLYTSGQTVTVDGNISGDLIVLTQNLTVNGSVDGDIIAFAQSVIINGSVGGNIRVISNNLTINSTVARNVTTLGSNIILGADSHIAWDAYFIGENLESRGIIDGNLSGRIVNTVITGKIGKDINLKLNSEKNNLSLTIPPEAIINGNLTYTSPSITNISSQAKISGQTKQINPENKKNNLWLAWLWAELFSIFSALVVGLVLIFIGKDISTKILTQLNKSPLKLILSGLILMFVLPIISLILMFTFIGIPLALIIGGIWLIFIYLAKILTAIFIGQIIIKTLNKNSEFLKHEVALFWSLIIGVIITFLLFSIPFIGWILSLVAIWFGLGGIYTYVKNKS